MITSIYESGADVAPTFGEEEVRALEVLRLRYQENRDRFSPRERAHLHFLRWLVRTQRLDPFATQSTTRWRSPLESHDIEIASLAAWSDRR
jgi:hypothetical protein